MSSFHFSITEARVAEACERRRSSLDNPGFCIDCGAEQGGVDGDAENGTCEVCGEDKVFGCEALLFEDLHPSPAGVRA